MAFRDTAGRETVVIVEIDQDLCSRTYGVSPCTAALGVTGTTKCYNTIQSCQDTANYVLGDPKTIRLCTSNEKTGLAKSTLAIPSILSVSTVPTRINIGGSNTDAAPLGERALITVTVRDHPYHDRLVDPYFDERAFDPAARGTFWGKWLARNPFYQNRAMRVITGYVGQTISEMSTRYYILDKINGPSQGVVEIIAKDPLKLLDDNRVKAPIANFGVLATDLTDDVDSSPLWSFDLTPTGIGSEYAASGIARIGSELVEFSRTDDTITLNSRGLRGSDVSSHATGDLFQEVLVISNTRIDLLLAMLMIDYAGVDPAFIDTVDWDFEADLWCSGFNLSSWITEPTGVAQLISEILFQTGAFIWWDEDEQQIRFRATRPFHPFTDAVATEVDSDRNIVADSLEIETHPDERVTQVWIYYAQENPAGALDDPSNFARRRIVTDDESEADIRYGDRRVRNIYARWLDEANDAATSVVATRILDRGRITPRKFKFLLDAKDGDIKTGEIIHLTHPDIVDLTGAPEPLYMQIVSHEAIDPGHLIQYEARQYVSRSRYCFIVSDGSPDYSAATSEEQSVGGWIAANAAGFANGDLAYRIL